MTDQHADEISLLDIAVFLAENWLALLVIPLFAAFATYMWAVLQEPTYTAAATLSLPAAGLAENGAVLTRIPNEFYRAAYAERDDVDINLRSNEVSIAAASSSPDDAAGLVTRAYNDLSKPLIDAMQAEIERASRVIDQVTPAMDQLRQELESDPDTAIALLNIQAAIEPHQTRVADATSLVEALHAPPAIVTSRVGQRHPAFYAILAGGSAGLTVLAALLALQGFRAAMKTENGQASVRRIQNGLLLRSSRPKT